MIDSLTFTDLDIKNMRNWEYAFQKGFNKVENHFLTKREYSEWFLATMIVESSSWDLEENHWRGPLEKSSKVVEVLFPNSKDSLNELLATVSELFEMCDEESKLGFVRGNLFERFFLAFYKRNFSEQQKLHSGSLISLRSQEWRCPCRSKQSTLCDNESCSGKSTSDLVSVFQSGLELFECKVSPNSAQCRDYHYFEYVKDELMSRSISSKAYFVVGTIFGSGPVEKMKKIIQENNHLKDYVTILTREHLIAK